MVIAKNDLLKSLNWRYATKKFDCTKKISEDDWMILEEVLRLSPSSLGLQPWKFIIVQNHDLREKLLQASMNQRQVIDCSHLVVLTTLTHITPEYIDRYMRRIMEVRHLSEESLFEFRNMIFNYTQNGFKPHEMVGWLQRQVYIAMGYLLETAAILHIDACPMEGINTSMYDAILGIEDGPYRSVAIVALGYRDREDKYQFQSKVRFLRESVIEYRY